MTRCPSCGAANGATARWCGQCFADLPGRPAGEPGTAGSSAVAAGSAAPAVPATGASPPPTGAPGSSGRADTGIRVGPDGRLQWLCVACESVNPLEASRCGVCATPFTARFDQGAAEVDWPRARRGGLLLPGLGHLRAGQAGSGIARMVLFVVWSLGGIGIGLGGGAAWLVAAPLLVGAAGLHVLSVRDLAALEAGRSELLAGRTLLWFVVGVTVLSVVSAALGLSAVRGG